jgi:general secretion pathway protein D
MLGGFIRSDDSKSKGGVPFLKDIPLIGLLFRSSSSDRRKNELVILIRPTVLPTPSDAVLAAREDKIQMPGIMRAEREYESDRLRQVDSERKKLLQQSW